MSERIVYVNGDYVPESKALISVFDRGFLMSDAVYEVSAVIDGKLLDNQGHLLRLQRSLQELGIPNPYTDAEWLAIQKKLLVDNDVKEGLVYLQVTRGQMDRDFLFDQSALRPNVVLFTQKKTLTAEPKGLHVMSIEDIRWARRDIKTTQLLAQSLAKMQAKAEGFDDCWFVENGLVTEGSSNNAWIIKNGKAITRPPSHEILNGITRRAQIGLLSALGLEFEERAFTLEEAMSADEAFSTSASAFVNPVLSINRTPIGTGNVGEKTKALRAAYLKLAVEQGV
ncbi:MAG: D-amino-acid transaminase [Cardiobacteriaceae bacterium]|nr:D-amino-acid transaminase [Cardiobacteriaceae bacterium]